MRAVMGWPADKRRKAALGLLAGVVLLALAVVALPLWLAHRHYDEALDDLGSRLVRYERLAAARPALQAKLEAVRAVGSRKYFLKAAAASLAAAEIQERARQFVEGNGGRLISVQVAQPKEDGRFRQVTVTVQANANIFATRKILHAIESAEPYLFVDAMTIRAQVPPAFKPAPGFEPEMFVQLDVSGFAIAN
ncbi:MAG TPA: type II secretion system protein GspM [Usitatibacteraceae bacterium]|jgi:general secretion pathway protein M|nr:type II secretion system protein GspM [Usitatibacteraceae bacterium]HQY45588.1 type II secretion system protein GspM [Usitatibacteraceae bacterium]HRA22044.1 type II secretion system protein GspM [Usitatibacteraceae bacterium]